MLPPRREGEEADQAEQRGHDEGTRPRGPVEQVRDAERDRDEQKDRRRRRSATAAMPETSIAAALRSPACSRISTRARQSLRGMSVRRSLRIPRMSPNGVVNEFRVAPCSNGQHPSAAKIPRDFLMGGSIWMTTSTIWGKRVHQPIFARRARSHGLRASGGVPVNQRCRSTNTLSAGPRVRIFFAPDDARR